MLCIYAGITFHKSVFLTLYMHRIMAQYRNVRIRNVTESAIYNPAIHMHTMAHETPPRRLHHKWTLQFLSTEGPFMKRRRLSTGTSVAMARCYGFACRVAMDTRRFVE